MPDYSLVPVDHQPDFSDISLVPVDHDPFGADGMTQQARTQLESQPQRLAAGAGLPDVGAPALTIEGASAGSRPVLLAAAGDNYPTADAAAIAALQEVNPTSQRVMDRSTLGASIKNGLALVIIHTHRQLRAIHLSLTPAIGC